MSAIQDSNIQIEKKKIISHKLSKYLTNDNNPAFEIEYLSNNPRMLQEMFEILGDVRVVLEEDLNSWENNVEDIEYLTVEETSEIFGVSPQAVYKWIKKGKINWLDKGPGGGYKIPKKQFEGKLLTDEKMNYARKTLGTDGTDVEILNKEELYGEIGEEF